MRFREGEGVGVGSVRALYGGRMQDSVTNRNDISQGYYSLKMVTDISSVEYISMGYVGEKKKSTVK